MKRRKISVAGIQESAKDIMSNDEPTQIIMSPVEEAIHNAQEDLIAAQSTPEEEISACAASDAEKKGMHEDDPDDILMQSFYEREWKKKQSPPLPIKEWASLFPNLRLTNSSVQDSNGATESIPSDESEEADVTQKRIQEIRSRLKEQLKKDLLETITCSGVV